MRHLVDRDLKGVQLIISDTGLVKSAAEYLPEANGRVRELSHMLKAIHAQESQVTAHRRSSCRKMSKAADLVEQSAHETLTYYAFPGIHWQKIRTNNPLERIMREFRRRTRVVGAFPDGQSRLNLAAACLHCIAGTAWSTKRYMKMQPLYHPQVVQTGAVA